MESPIKGVWELVSDDSTGLYVATDTHFSCVTVRQDRRAWQSGTREADISDEMRVEAWKGLRVAIAGTYEVLAWDGSEAEIRFTQLVNKSPIPARVWTDHLVFEGETMTDDTGTKHEVWRRLATSF